MQTNIGSNIDKKRFFAAVGPQTVEKRSYRCARPMAWLTVLFAVVFGTLAGQAQVITRVSSPGKFYVDDKAGIGIVYNYAAYTISNNTAAVLPSVYVAITNIVATNRIQVAPSDTGSRSLGALAPGQTKMAAFFLTGPSFTGNSDTLLGLTNENHTIQVLNGPPGVGSLLASANYSYTNIIYAIEALANKVTLITNLNPYAELGTEVLMIIAGDTGTIGGENSVSFSPAVLGGWRPDCYELNGSIVTFTENPTYTNRLYFDPFVPGFTNFTGQSYTNTFYFRAVKPTVTNIAISPFAFVDSGSGTKHTAFSSLANSGGSNIIYSATNVITIFNQTVTPTSLLAPGGVVTYSISITNFAVGSASITLDEIVDTLPGTPGNATYVPGSATFNAVSIADPTIVGQALHWAQPFVISTNGASVLTFQAVMPLPAGQYTNKAIALIGGTQIDTTADTTDNSPSQTIFTIIPVSNLGVSKSSPASVLAGNNFNYTVNVTNLGPSPNTSYAVTDSLPANVTFVSASAGGVFTGGQVIWTNLGTLTATNSTNLTITVTAPSEGTTLTNTASVGSPILDSNPTNNTTPPLLTTVNSAASLVIAKSGPAGPVLPGVNFNYTISVTNLGPSAAVSVTVTDTLPANITFVSASGGGSLSGGAVIWNLGNFAAGVFTNLTLTVTSPLKGSVTNVASAGSSILDTNLVNNVTPPVVTTVTNVPPSAVNDSSSTPRNVAVTIHATANDSDANGDVLTITLVNPTNGTASIVSGTNVLFTPATNFQGSATVGYTISDGFGGNASALITISVTNRPPLALNDTTTGSNGVAQVINPLVNDSDADGDSLIITNVVANNGTVVINPGNTNLTFTPTNDLTATITYTITDGFGGSASATITVVGQNTAPVANPDSATTPVNTPVTIPATANDTDANSDPLTIISVSPTNGTATIVNGTNVLFTPSTNFDGSATIGYVVDDGRGGTATGLITVTVTPVADVGVSKSSPGSVTAGANFNYTITLTNVGPSASGSLSVTDNLPASLVFVSASDGGFLSGGQVIWTNLPALPANSGTNLTLTVTAPANGTSLTNTASVGGPVSDPNPTNNTTPPNLTTVNSSADLSITKTPSTGSPLPGANFNYTLVVTNAGPSIASSVTVTDALPANLTFVSASGGGVFSGGNVTWSLGNLAANTSTNLTLTVTAPTKGGITNSATLGSPTGDPNPTNNVSPPATNSVANAAPNAVNDFASTPKNTTVLVPVLANDSDPNGDPLSISAVSPTNGTALISGTNVSFTPTSGFAGSATCGYTISDGLGGFASAVITITVTNRAPVANGQSVSTAEDTAKAITLTGSDPDSDTLTYSIVSGPTNGTISGFNTNTGALTYTPGTNFNGSDAFTFLVNDGSTSSQPALVSITVTAVNDAPFANGQSVTTPEDTAKPITLTGSDVEGSTLTFAIVTGPTNGTISGFNASTGALTYTPGTNYNGNDAFTFTVNDGSTNSQPALVNITVTPVNDAPFANGQSVSTPEDTAKAITLSGSDVEGSSLTFVIVSGPTNGIISSFNTNSGALTYTPNTNFNGGDSFTFRVNDGTNNSAPATVGITVTPVNDAPVAINQSVTTPEDTATNLVLTATDVDSTNFTFTNLTAPTNGVITGFNTNTGAFTYRPNTNYNGPDFLRFTVSDGSLLATGQVSITVTPVNDAPFANAQSVTTPEDTAKAITLTGSDIEGGTLFYFIVANPTNGTISGFNGITGTLTYTPNTNFNGTDAFTFIVNDGSSNSQPALVSINVTPVNDAPVANGQSVTTPEDAAKAIALTGSDVEGSALTYSIVAGPTNGTISGFNAGTGALTYTPNANFNGTDAFTFTVNDGTTNSQPALVSITVTPVNDAPVANGDSYSTTANTTLNVAAPGVLTNDTDVESNALTAVLATGVSHGSLALSANGSFTYTPAANYSGPDSFTYRANDGSSNSAPATVNLTVIPTADIAVILTGPTNVTPSETFTFTIIVTNFGPSTASNLVVLDVLPTNLVFVSTSGGGVLTSNTVTWPTIPSLPSGAATNFLITVTAPTNGTFVIIGSATSFTLDPDPLNNDGSAAGSRLTATVVPIPFGYSQTTPTLNPQTGLYEERVTVTNTSASTAAAVRVLVGNINSTNGTPRTNVFLYNASGTNVDSRPYVQHNAPLNPGQTLLFTLEFYVPDRRPFTNSIEVQAVLPTQSTNSGVGAVLIDRAFMDTRTAPSRFVLEWASVPGKTYTIIYRDSLAAPWNVATPSITANATRTQWYDDGPPKTLSAPASASSRYYQVIVSP